MEKILKRKNNKKSVIIINTCISVGAVCIQTNKNNANADLKRINYKKKSMDVQKKVQFLRTMKKVALGPSFAQ